MKAPLLALFFCMLHAGAQDNIPGGGKAEPDLPVPAPAPKVEVEPPDWNIHWEFHVVTLPTKEAHPLLAELRDEMTAAAGWAKLQEMIKRKQATVAIDTGGRVMQGDEAEFFQGEEVRYPIEYEGPAVVEPAKGADPAKIPEPKAGQPISVAYLPTTFETRKVGIGLSVNATASVDGKRLKVVTAAEHTWLLKWDEFDVGRLSNNEKITYKQPRFVSVKLRETSGMLAGERRLLSSHSLTNEPERTELFFLRVWTTLRKPAETK